MIEAFWRQTLARHFRPRGGEVAAENLHAIFESVALDIFARQLDETRRPLQQNGSRLGAAAHDAQAHGADAAAGVKYAFVAGRRHGTAAASSTASIPAR